MRLLTSITDQLAASRKLAEATGESRLHYFIEMAEIEAINAAMKSARDKATKGRLDGLESASDRG